KSELRIAGGRERHLRSLQPLGLMIANSIFVGDYLTTQGQAPSDDYRMIQDLGFEITGQVALPDETLHSENTCTNSTGCGSCS
ncbi:MAG: biotin synthase BioB, partial [Planctomycetes bacterium]|nr:biotin synthase BioB [Planctomycetota bacterium]